MTEAPWVSTFVAVALVPVAVLFSHAYLSGRHGLRYHRLTGTAGILWDLSLSIFYMIYRLTGAEVEGSVLEITPSLAVYFAVHGLIAAAVIALEITMLSTGLIQWKRDKKISWHRKLALPLYVLWFAAFLSGETVYVVYYVL